MMETAQMQFVAGVVFAAVALFFLWKVFFSNVPLQPLHYDIVHFVCSFCAGAAGAFFTGAAILSAEVPLNGGGMLAFQGSAGVALFALVFFVFRLKKGPNQDPAPGATVSIGTQSPFVQVANALADEAGATIDLSVLNEAEKLVVPRAAELRCGNLQQTNQSLIRLAELMPHGSVRPYRVDLDAAAKHFKIVLI